MPDYTKMEGPEMLSALGDNAAKWADAFCQIATQHGLVIDQGWMIGWFANAIEHSYDVRTGRGPTTMPDGSAFFVGLIE